MSENVGAQEPEIGMREMLEAGLHFGHQSRYWNPQMAPYLYGKRNQIHIINLEKTLALYRRAMKALARLEARDSGEPVVLFVGTKRSARDAVREQAERCGQPYVNQRWLGGLLTNFRTLKKSVDRLRAFEEGGSDADNWVRTKKEASRRRRELRKLERDIGGIRDLARLPDAMFVIDIGYEHIAVREAARMGVPVYGVVDSNNDPGKIDYVIPGNDDSTSAVRLCLRGAADALIAARDERERRRSGDFMEEEDETTSTGAA